MDENTSINDDFNYGYTKIGEFLRDDKGVTVGEIVVWDSIPFGKEYQNRHDTVYSETGEFERILIDEGWKFTKTIANRLYHLRNLQHLNLDRNYPFGPSELCQIRINTTVLQRVYANIIFKGRKVLVPDERAISSNSSNLIYFRNIPKHQEVKFISYYTENGQFYFAIQELTVSSDIELTPIYKKVDKVEIEDYISKLEWP